jgi:hypothetical protein
MKEQNDKDKIIASGHGKLSARFPRLKIVLLGYGDLLSDAAVQALGVVHDTLELPCDRKDLLEMVESH